MKESGVEKGGNVLLISSRFYHGTVCGGSTEKHFPEISNQYFSLAAPRAKLQNTGSLLKRVSPGLSLEWFGGWPVALTGEPLSRRATKLYTFEPLNYIPSSFFKHSVQLASRRATKLYTFLVLKHSVQLASRRATKL